MYFPPRCTLLLYFLLYLGDVEPFFIVQQGNLPSNRGGHFYARSRHSYMAVPAPPSGVLMHFQQLRGRCSTMGQAGIAFLNSSPLP